MEVSGLSHFIAVTESTVTTEYEAAGLQDWSGSFGEDRKSHAPSGTWTPKYPARTIVATRTKVLINSPYATYRWEKILLMMYGLRSKHAGVQLFLAGYSGCGLEFLMLMYMG